MNINVAFFAFYTFRTQRYICIYQLSFTMTIRLNIPIDDDLYEQLTQLPGKLTEKVRAALKMWVPVEKKRLLEELKKSEGEHTE